MGKPALRVVDDEMQGHGTPLPIKISRVERLEGQPRRWFDPISLEELADNIQTEGQHQPILVARHPEKSGVFVIIGGERRWRAKKIIGERTGVEPTIDAFIKVVHSMKELFRLAYADNLRHEDLIPLDEAAAFHRFHFEDKMSTEAIRILAGKSKSYVEGYIKMHSLPEGVKELMDPALPQEERLSVTSAIDIARGIPNPKLQLAVAMEAIERELGVAETRVLIGVRGGKIEASFGGRLRVPGDDYRVLQSFVGRTLATAERFGRTLHMPSLYQHRKDEADDRRRDAQKLRRAMSSLDRLLKAIEGGGNS